MTLLLLVSVAVGVLRVMLVTVGAMLSITSALLPPRDLSEARAGRFKSASMLTLSLMAPPLSLRAVVVRYCKSRVVSPG